VSLKYVTAIRIQLRKWLPSCLSNHMWSRCDLHLWSFDLIIWSVYLYLQLHQSYKFGERKWEFHRERASTVTVATSTNKALHWQLDVMLLNRNGAVSWQTKVPYERYSTHFQRAPSTCWHFGEAGIEILNASRYSLHCREGTESDRQTDWQTEGVPVSRLLQRPQSPSRTA